MKGEDRKACTQRVREQQQAMRRWWAYWILEGIQPAGYNGMSYDDARATVTEEQQRDMRSAVRIDPLLSRQEAST